MELDLNHLEANATVQSERQQLVAARQGNIRDSA